MTHTTLNIPDITCEHCERTITNALTPIEGIQGVAVDIPAKQVQMEYDPDRVSLEQIKTVLEEEYYPVASVAGSDQTTMKENVPVADTLKTTAIDPVCGMSVDTQTARLTTDYEGQTTTSALWAVSGPSRLTRRGISRRTTRSRQAAVPVVLPALNRLLHPSAA